MLIGRGRPARRSGSIHRPGLISFVQKEKSRTSVPEAKKEEQEQEVVLSRPSSSATTTVVVANGDPPFRKQSNPGKKVGVESPSRLAPSTPQSQSFVNKKGGLLLSPTLERPGKESFYWEMCYMETEMKTFKDVMEGLKVIGAGTATIALAGAAVGIGKIFSSLIHSVARSP
ncbi:hypothetical protein L1987_89175 [Smallanthus sonchifolius]|nr:hypothetical protein L1987_89175 [Smallanthus sonchifolius]